MVHDLKIEQHYLIHILEGKKNFEVIKNDRDYQVGDRINFLPLESESESYNAYDVKKPIPKFIINYVHHGYGMENGFVILAIEAV